MSDFLNVSVVLAFLSVAVSIISSIIMRCITKKNESHEITIRIGEIRDIRINIDGLKDLIERERGYLKDDNIDACFKVMVDRIQQIYPQITISVSIKLIEGLGKNTTNKSLVYSWYSYPDRNYDDRIDYVIKNNTDFSSIIQNKNEYFFVSDLREFSTISQYNNSSDDFLYKYNSSIVCPICKKEKGQMHDIVGFLCVDSPQKLNNVKKNEKVINLVKATTSTLYEYINQNKDNPNLLSARDNV